MQKEGPTPCTDSTHRALFNRYFCNTSCCLLVLILSEFNVASGFAFATSLYLLIFYVLPVHCLPAFPLLLNYGTCILFNYQWRQHDTVESRTINTLTATLNYDVTFELFTVSDPKFLLTGNECFFLRDFC